MSSPEEKIREGLEAIDKVEEGILLRDNVSIVNAAIMLILSNHLSSPLEDQSSFVIRTNGASSPAVFRLKSSSSSPSSSSSSSSDSVTVRSVSIFEELLLVHATRSSNKRTATLRLNPQDFVWSKDEGSNRKKKRKVQQVSLGGLVYNVDIFVLKMRVVNALLNSLLGNNDQVVASPCLHLLPPLCMQSICSYLTSIELAITLGSVSRSVRISTHSDHFLWERLISRDFPGININKQVSSHSHSQMQKQTKTSKTSKTATADSAAPPMMEQYCHHWQNRQRVKKEEKARKEMASARRGMMAMQVEEMRNSYRRNESGAGLWLPRGSFFDGEPRLDVGPRFPYW